MNKKLELRKRKIALENQIAKLKIEQVLAKTLKEEQEIQNKIDQIEFELSNIAFEEM